MKRSALVFVLLVIALSGLFLACGGGGGGGGNAVFSFTSTDTPITIPDHNIAGIISSQVVTGAPTSISNVTVSVRITHTYVDDLAISLESAEGTTVVLADSDGEDGNNFWDTLFDDNASSSIESTDSPDAPYTGSYRPQGLLSDFDGEDANGTWVLNVSDGGPGDTGSLVEWTLNIE